MRVAALQLAAAVVAGVGEGDRNSGAVQAEALRTVARAAKEAGAADAEMRLALAGAPVAETLETCCVHRNGP